MITLMRKLILVLLVPTLLFARQKAHVIPQGDDLPYIPWFTGTGLAPTATNFKLGHPGMMGVLTAFYNYGEYDNNWKLKSDNACWNINTLIDIQAATTERTGIEVIASFSASFQGSKHSTHFTDTLLLLGYQVSDDQRGTWIPDFRLAFETIFPTGNFRELRPENNGIDETGLGAYFFGPNFAFQKLFHLENNFFALIWSAAYLLPTRARIKDHSIYGGGLGTRGTIRPGPLLTAFVSGEYSINQRWVFAFDTACIYQEEAHNFKGTTVEPIEEPTTIQISFSPQVEYNFTAHSGLIIGAWLTLAGRNAAAFAAVYLNYSKNF